jgi:hypothetical protein
MLEEDEDEEDVCLCLCSKKRDVHFMPINPVQITHAIFYGFSMANRGARIGFTPRHRISHL